MNECFRPLARAVEPHKIRLFTEPDQLSTRIATVLLGDERARRRLISYSSEHLHYLPIYQPAKWSRGRRHSLREQASHLVGDATRELLIDPARHAFSREGSM
jgi:hypothetical protein